MLTPEIMPATWAFAKQSQTFNEHYSSGNGTRMGIFGQFYGLNGEFWFPALKYQRSPFLLDLLQDSGYQTRAYTSAKFSYPEFDKTVWLNIEDDDLKEQDSGVKWERDQKNVSDLIKYIEDSESPFLTFMFFESTHANYYFPEKSIIRENYLEDFDYLSTDIEGSIELIKNRYINASNHLDYQFSRIISTLKEEDLLKETIVIITGDHGEEFMENGRWGHNSTFSQQQIRVPLLIHIPGSPAAHYEGMTSHLDIPATVLSALKAGHDPQTYSMGQNLLSSVFDREFAVISDWHSSALATAHHKFSLSSKANSRGSALTSLDDKPVASDELPDEVSTALSQFLMDQRRFNSNRQNQTVSIDQSAEASEKDR